MSHHTQVNDDNVALLHDWLLTKQACCHDRLCNAERINRGLVRSPKELSDDGMQIWAT